MGGAGRYPVGLFIHNYKDSAETHISKYKYITSLYTNYFCLAATSAWSKEIINNHQIHRAQSRSDRRYSELQQANNVM